jgi:hypothetical protein
MSEEQKESPPAGELTGKGIVKSRKPLTTLRISRTELENKKILAGAPLEVALIM